MSEKQKLHKLLTWAITLLFAEIVIGLGTGCVFLYLDGKKKVTAGTAEFIFTRSSSLSFLKLFVFPVIILVLLLILAAYLKVRTKEMRPYLDSGVTKALRQKESISVRKRMDKRGYLIGYGLAVVLIIVGIMNGGARDVLIKAINICTECIGLG